MSASQREYQWHGLGAKVRGHEREQNGSRTGQSTDGSRPLYLDPLFVMLAIMRRRCVAKGKKTVAIWFGQMVRGCETLSRRVHISSIQRSTAVDDLGALIYICR